MRVAIEAFMMVAAAAFALWFHATPTALSHVSVGLFIIVSSWMIYSSARHHPKRARMMAIASAVVGVNVAGAFDAAPAQWGSFVIVLVMVAACSLLALKQPPHKQPTPHS